MRAGKGIAVLVVLASLAMPATSGADLYDPAAECVFRSGTGSYTPVQRRPTYEVLGRRATRAEARRVDELIRDEDFWDYYSARFDAPRHDVAPDGSTVPFQIYVSNEVPDEYGGFLAPYCENRMADSIVIADDLGPRSLRSAVPHELFHAFAAGEADALVIGWWAEATASWAEMQLGRDDERVERLDRQFLQRPTVPIHHRVTDPAHFDRPYGAWRFVEWLGPRIGGDAALYSFMAATFRRMGAGEDAVSAVREELAAKGHDLGEDLGQFWGERLFPSNPLTGRATEGRTIQVPADDPAGPGELTETHELKAGQLAAEVVRLRLPRRSHVQRITITVEAAPPGTYLWAQSGRVLEDWSGGETVSFCVGGTSPATGAGAWPGQLPLAFTNGNSGEPHDTLSHFVTVTVSAEECEGFVPDPSAAIDDSPVLDLPDRCPREPRYFAPPPREGGPDAGLHTDYFVFRERINRVFESASTWLRAAVAEVSRRDLGQRAAGRLIARWFYCSARRARELDHLPETDSGPDELIQRWRRQFVAKLRQVARTYERGRIGAAIGPLSDAGRIYSQIVGRCTVQDIATAEP